MVRKGTSCQSFNYYCKST